MRTIAVVGALAALVGAVPGCGGGEEGSSPAQEAEVAAIVEERIASEDELTDVRVSEVEVEGDTATARVTGSDALDGEFADFTVELVDDGGWKVDGFR